MFYLKIVNTILCHCHSCLAQQYNKSLTLSLPPCCVCFSFGYCEKEDLQSDYKPIGYYGNGFKSGSMRLGKDAMVFTRCMTSMSVGFLSQTYLEVTKADAVIVPIVTWNLPSNILFFYISYGPLCD